MANRAMKAVRSPIPGVTVLALAFAYDAVADAFKAFDGSDIKGPVKVSGDAKTVELVTDPYWEILSVVPHVTGDEADVLTARVTDVTRSGAKIHVYKAEVDTGALVSTPNAGDFEAHVLIVAKNTMARP